MSFPRQFSDFEMHISWEIMSFSLVTLRMVLPVYPDLLPWNHALHVNQQFNDLSTPLFRRTPFHAAASSGHVECLRLLLDAASEAAAHENPTCFSSSSSSSSRHNNNDEDDGQRRGSNRSSTGANMEPVTMTRLGSCSSRKIQRGSVGNRNSLSRTYVCLDTS